MRFNFVKWRSLKARVTLCTLVIFLISVWSLAFYAGRMLRQDMQRMLGEQQFSTVSLAAAQVNTELTDRLSGLKIIAGEITPGLLADTAALQSYLEQHAIFRSLFNGGVVVVRPDGTEIAGAPFGGRSIDRNYMDVDSVAAARVQLRRAAERHRGRAG